jgi:dTDP-4-dehydrorhamnose reductase
MTQGKLLILGRDGMLGSMLRNLALANSLEIVTTSHANYAPIQSHEGETIVNFDAVSDEINNVLELHPRISCIINCIGVVKQSTRAQDVDYMRKVNASFPLQLGKVASERSVKLIHLSSDCVFSGSKGDYRESDIADASDSYGLSKLSGEEVVDSGAMVIRTSMIGREIGLNKRGLLEWFLNSRGKTVQGYTRVFFSGLTTRELAKVILEIIAQEKIFPGIWHIAGQKISKFELLERINSKFELSVRLLPVDEPMMDRSLVAQKSTALLGFRVPSWDSMLSNESWSDTN